MSRKRQAKAVCVVSQSYYDIDNRIRRKAAALASAGYAVDVLCLRLPNRERNYAMDGVSIHTLSLGKQRGSLARYLFEYVAFFVWIFFKVPAMMRRRRYAAIDVNSLPDFLVFAPVIARWMGAKLVLDLHEITPEFYMSKYAIPEDSWIVRLLKFQERISVKFADHVITISEPIQLLLEERGLPRTKSTVVMNTADEARFAASIQKHPGPDPVPGKFIMLYHGTLTKIYGLDLAVEAFALVHQEMPEAELWIVGFGPEAETLEALAGKRGLSEKVRFIGQVSADEIPQWLKQSTVGVLPIRRDVFLEYAFPNKLPECIITGKAVIISRLKTIAHYFTADALAFFEPNDAVDLGRQMVRLYRDPELRDHLCRQATKEYAAIRWELMRQRYLTLMDGLIGPTPGAEGRSTPARSAVA